MKTQMIKLVTIVSFSVVVAASLPRIAIAHDKVSGQSEVDRKFIEVLQNNSKEVSIDLSLVPQVGEFEGFINYGSAIPSTSTDTLGQPSSDVIRPSGINQPIFSTRKVLNNVSVFDGQPVVLGGLLREEVQNVANKTTDGGVSNLQKLIKERDLLKQRLLEVEALIEKAAKE